VISGEALWVVALKAAVSWVEVATAAVATETVN
jgi:hypothetical protein